MQFKFLKMYLDSCSLILFPIHLHSCSSKVFRMYLDLVFLYQITGSKRRDDRYLHSGLTKEKKASTHTDDTQCINQWDSTLQNI